MDKFQDFQYERPDYENILKEIDALVEKVKNAKSKEDLINSYYESSKVMEICDSMVTLASIRNTIDTKDEFYEKEVEFNNEMGPKVAEKIMDLSKAFVESPFRQGMEEEFGKYLLEKNELQLKTFRPEIMDDLVRESQLSVEYQKLIASCEKEFQGEKRNLVQLGKFVQDNDREVRKEATLLVAEFFQENLAEFDRIYDELVKVRNTMAKKLGYDNYVELGYNAMGRLDYNADDVKNYRKQILEEVVPLTRELRKRQAERISIDKLKFYDEGLQFKSGNAKPHGDKDWMLERASKMYKELSSETDEFFQFMLEKDLFDLDSKPGKAGGGYCTYLEKWRTPFIFANFNGTTGDVEVLTHEAGHAFQIFNSRDHIVDYRWPGMESAEIHSMSMEFFTWPWMDLFFEDEVEKFKFQHLQGAVLFLPYGALIDEFQHFVYENPEASPEERRKKYSELEKKYLPDRDYDGIEVLENGGFWLRQSHVFQRPFYYIDYTLAQVCAFQFLKKSMEDHDKAWSDYLRLCKTGGSKPFLELLEVAGLENPFKDGTIKDTMKPVIEILNSIDDRNL